MDKYTKLYEAVGCKEARAQRSHLEFRGPWQSRSHRWCVKWYKAKAQRAWDYGRGGEANDNACQRATCPAGAALGPPGETSRQPMYERSSRPSAGGPARRRQPSTEGPTEAAPERPGAGATGAVSSDEAGPRDGPRRPRRSRPRARRPERPRPADSSLDESLDEQSRREPARRRSRASRTERYLRRVGSGTRAPGPAARLAGCEYDVTDDNFYARHTQVGVSPLLRRPIGVLGGPARAPSPPAPPRPPTPPSRDQSSRGLLGGYPRRPMGHWDRDGASLDVVCPSVPVVAARRSCSDLEEALCELEAIYDSLQLGDEELLDRAELRSMEEFLYKGLTPSPDARDGLEPEHRRKTWANAPPPEDRLKDDMAYRRMHPKERPTSVDGRSGLCSVSYLMLSPVPCRRQAPFVEPSKRARAVEPDVTLDDVVFRNMHYANNTLKVVEPQPPFGIPLGPITAAADSDYLHSKPTDPERARSPYVAARQPDIVTDDLAFRNLRKDALLPSGRQSSPSFLPSAPSPLPGRDARPEPSRRAARPPSAGLYGSIGRPDSPPEPDEDREPPSRRAGRRTSEPRAPSPDRRKPQISGDWQHQADPAGDPAAAPAAAPAARPCEPLAQHEVSVYKQLCEDLQRLVQLTQASDAETAEPARMEPGPEIGDESPPMGPGRPPASADDGPGKAVAANGNRSCAAVEDDEDETRDRVDEATTFPRNVQLAWPAGHRKESAPNSAVVRRRASLLNDDGGSSSQHWQGMNKCNHKYNSMPAKTSSLLMFRQFGSKRKSKNRKSMCTIA